MLRSRTAENPIRVACLSNMIFWPKQMKTGNSFVLLRLSLSSHTCKSFAEQGRNWGATPTQNLHPPVSKRYPLVKPEIMPTRGDGPRPPRLEVAS